MRGVFFYNHEPGAFQDREGESSLCIPELGTKTSHVHIHRLSFPRIDDGLLVAEVTLSTESSHVPCNSCFVLGEKLHDLHEDLREELQQVGFIA